MSKQGLESLSVCFDFSGFSVANPNADSKDKKENVHLNVIACQKEST
jgi:hypothetical protein